MKQLFHIVGILLLLQLFFTFSYGQQSFTGHVVDKTSAQPIQGVTITLLGTKDSIRLSFVTNAKGIFSRTPVPKGNYSILTNSIGYKPARKDITISDKPIHVFFRLEPIEMQIEEVEILASPLVVLRGDTTEFDARNFSTREFAEADELVAQIPGVLIDEDGNVSAHGEEVTKIIVDGKEFFSTDPRIALKTLPAEIISKIQIIDEKSEQAKFSGFDDGTRSKVINIVTKPDRRHGYFGKANTGLGAENKFGISGNLNKFDGDKKLAINLMANNINETNFSEQGRGGNRGGNNNTDRGLSDTYAGAVNFTNTYLDKTMELSGDYNFRSLRTATHSLSDIEYLLPSRANQFREQDQYSDIASGEHKFKSRLRWNIDSVHRIDVSPNITYNSSSRDVTTDYITMLGQISPINSSARTNSSDNSNFNFGGALTYMFRFKKKGRTFSASISGNKSTNEAAGVNLAMTSYYRDATLSRIDTNNNRSSTDGYGSGFRSRLSLTETISAHSRLQANYTLRNTAGYSKRETYEFLAETGQLGELRDRLSNEFRNDYVYHGTGLSYIYNKPDIMRIQVGMNYEHGIRKNDRQIPYPIYTEANFDSFLPEMTFKYYFSKEHNLEANYNTETRTPSINQLQDFVNDHNELNISNGNPNLKQEYTHIFRLQYKDINKTTGRSLNTSIAMEYINDKIINSILMPLQDSLIAPNIVVREGGRYTSPENMDGAYTARLQNSYGLPIKKWKLNLNFNSRLFYNNDFALVNQTKVNNTSYGFSQTFGINSNINKQYVIGLRYNIRGTYYENLLAPVPRYNVYVHRLSNNITIEPVRRIVLHSGLSYFVNTGLMDSNTIKTTLWNASLGYKLFQKQNGEIALKGFDLLNNAQNINRRVNENAVTNVLSNTLNRYFILSFTYHLRQFGSAQR